MFAHTDATWVSSNKNIMTVSIYVFDFKIRTSEKPQTFLVGILTSGGVSYDFYVLEPSNL